MNLTRLAALRVAETFRPCGAAGYTLSNKRRVNVAVDLSHPTSPTTPMAAIAARAITACSSPL